MCPAPPNAGSGVHAFLIINAFVVFFCDEFYQLLANDRWFSLGTLASSTTKTGRHAIAEVLLKVALSTINQMKSNNCTFLDTRKDGCYSYSCIPNIERGHRRGHDRMMVEFTLYILAFTL